MIVQTKGKLVRPVEVLAPNGCKGKVTVSVKRGSKVLRAKKVDVRPKCGFNFKTALRRAKVDGARKLTVVAAFRGNSALAPTTRSHSIPVRS